jgi:hypothetical protein
MIDRYLPDLAMLPFWVNGQLFGGNANPGISTKCIQSVSPLATRITFSLSPQFLNS